MTPRFVTLFLAAVLVVPASAAALSLPIPLLGGPLPQEPSVSDVTITSWDGTELAATLFVPEDATALEPVPFVLMTHGWAGSRQATATGRVADLLDAGYGVLTWDSRGFGASGGEVMLDHPDYEGRDVSVLIDWLVLNAPVAMDGANDPRVGMSGGSYAGGIQLLAAAVDDRIDVIAPEITWNNLVQSLAPNGVPKLQWVSLLFGGGLATSCSDGHSADLTPSGCQTTALARYYATVMATNGVTPEVEAALLARSPATYMDDIQVPALIIQGAPDTLFDVDQAVANYEGIKANGQPAKLWIYDGGHAGPNTQGGLISGVVIDWMDCHLALVADCADVGAPVEYYAGDSWYESTEWPPASTASSKTVAGIPPIAFAPTPAGSNGEWVIPLDAGDEANVKVLVGGATVTFDANTVGGKATLFASLGIRAADGTITRLGDQTQPIRIAGGESTPYTLDLVDVTAEYVGDQSLVLRLTTFDQAYNNARSAGMLYVTNIETSWSTATV